MNGAGYASLPFYHDNNYLQSVVTRMNPVNHGTYSIAQHLAHEIGHTLDLKHTYDGNCSGIHGDMVGGNGDSCCPETSDMNSNEYIGDIFNYSDNWCSSPAGFCYECVADDPYDNITGHSSNNFMGGTDALHLYLSPLQIGKMHRASQIKSIRQFLWGYNTQPIEITGVEEWDFSIKMYNDLVIKSGAELTIKCEVQMVPEAKIIIEPGARLIVDGGVITKAKHSKDYWQGIEVWGQSNLNQFNPVNQGKLITRNNATIEYARNAIRVWKHNDWNSTGGVIDCRETTFKNNWRSCEYIRYHSYSASNPNLEIPNQGKFTDCTFLWDDDYIGTSTASAITMYHVNGVQITGCDFLDERSGTGLSRPNGIFSHDAGYRVIGRYLGLGGFYPPTFVQDEHYSETNYDVNHFKNLKAGVHAMNSTTSFNIMVDHSKFENITNGVILDAVDNAVITRNKFDVIDPLPTGYTGGSQLSTRESNNYRLEGNLFSRSSSAGAVGTYILNSGPDNNEVYDNIFEGINVGNWATGFNSNDQSGINTATGLQWLCNEYETGYIDEFNHVITYDPLDNGEGVRLLQGLPDNPAGNRFSQSITSGPPQGDAHILHQDLDFLAYFCFNGDPVQEPTVIDGNAGVVFSSEENECLSNFQSTIVVEKDRIVTAAMLPVLESELSQIDTDIVVKNAELQALKHHGDRVELYHLVENLSNENKEQVRSSLLNESPYVSQGVLEALGQKQPSLFPHSWYKDLIMANIEVARNYVFMQSLLEKPTPMPQGLYNQIHDARLSTFTERGYKEMALLELDRQRGNILNLFIIDELADSTQIDWLAIKQLFLERENIDCRREIADYHLSREDIPSCHATLDLIELQLSSYSMDRVKQELQDFVMFKRYMLTITAGTGIIDSLGTAEIQQLEYIADNFQGKASRQARNILCFFAGMCEEIAIEIPEPQNNNKMAVIQNETTELEELLALRIVPNPNDGVFELIVPEGCVIVQLSVVDIHGKQVEFEHVERGENQSSIRLIAAKNGLYLVLATCTDSNVYRNRVLITK